MITPDLKFACGQLKNSNPNTSEIVRIVNDIGATGEIPTIPFRHAEFSTPIIFSDIKVEFDLSIVGGSWKKISFVNCPKIRNILLKEMAIEEFESEQSSAKNFTLQGSRIHPELKFKKKSNFLKIELLENSKIKSISGDDSAFTEIPKNPSGLLQLEFNRCVFCSTVEIEPTHSGELKSIVFEDSTFEDSAIIGQISSQNIQLISLARSKVKNELRISNAKSQKVLLSGTKATSATLTSIDTSEISTADSAFGHLQLQGNFRTIDFGNLIAESLRVKCEGYNQIIAEEMKVADRLEISGEHITRLKIVGSEINGILSTNSLNILELFCMEDSKINSVSIKNAKFGGRTSFNRSTFSMSPNFENSKFPQDTGFIGCIFNDVKSESAGARYRDLKQKMDDLDNEQARIQFAALELAARKHQLPKLSLERMCSTLYRYFNNYGQHPSLPIAWIVLSFFISAPYFASNQNIVANVKYSELDFQGTWLSELHKTKTVMCLELSNAGLVYAGLNSLGPIRILNGNETLMPKNWKVHFVGLVHSVLATIWLYLLITAVKKRLSINS